MKLITNIALVLVAVILLIPIGYIFWRLRLKEKIIDKLDKQNPPEAEEFRARVWITNDKDYRTLLTLTPSKEIGIISITPKKISLYSINTKGNTSVQQIDRINLHAEWLVNNLAPYSLVPWLTLADARYGNSPIYITAYVGMKALLSGNPAQALNQTKELYSKLTGKQEKLPKTNLFALEKNPASLFTLTITALLLIYAGVDGWVLNPLEIVSYQPEFIPLIFALLVIAYVVFSFYKIMKKKSVPPPEAFSLAMLFGVVLILAAIPAIKRIDTATATKPMQNYDYKANEKDILEPLQEGLPKLPFVAKNEYWKQFDDNHTFQFPLQKGGFGFWQFDGRELYKDIEAFYANKNEDKNSEQPESDER
ncbi:MAG: hypothetical protein JW914_09730 [Syntrophaceae bacterium]|nr:hypothetical protein [Syntrophaceae bacterium]